MKGLEVCRHHDLAADDGVPSDGASERHKKMPRLGLGPAGASMASDVGSRL
jgi:hypothetical protein